MAGAHMVHTFRIGQLVRLKGRSGIFEIVHQLAVSEDRVPLYSIRGTGGERVVGEHEIFRA
jgi:hypothetical protein